LSGARKCHPRSTIPNRRERYPVSAESVTGTLAGTRCYTKVMRRLLSLLFVSLLLGQGLAALLPQDADDCTDAGCTPVNCSQACPTCVCAIDRDRLAPSFVCAIPLPEPLREAPHGGSFIPPQPRAREILHVPKPYIA
jgi:hypothetical protein